jgi:hypothetical protein
MDAMSRRRVTTVTAWVSSLALLATLPAPCACLPAPVAAAQHACCAPPAGIRPADPGCCSAPVVAPDPVTASSVAKAAVAPVLVVVASVTSPAGPVCGHSQTSPTPAVSPPLSVRRL